MKGGAGKAFSRTRGAFRTQIKSFRPHNPFHRIATNLHLRRSEYELLWAAVVATIL